MNTNIKKIELNGYENKKEFFKEKILIYYETLRKYASVITEDWQVAQDVVQDTMIEAWKHLNRYRNAENIKGMLLCTTKRLCIDRYRKKKRITYVPEIPDTYIDIEQELENIITGNETSEEIQTAISAMPQKHARILIMMYWYDMSLKEISQITGEKYSTEAARKNQALIAMGKTINKMGITNLVLMHTFFISLF